MAGHKLKKLALLQPSASYGPEVDALAEYVKSVTAFGAEVLASPDELDPSIHLAIYRMMGTSPRWSRKTVPEIHDYASLSTGRFPKAKDMVKKTINSRPVFRLFLNDAVCGAYRFRDSVPWSLRDMGVPQAFLDDRSPAGGEYTFAYCGSITRSRETDRLIQAVRDAKSSVTLIGSPEPSIYREYNGLRGVEFVGKVPRVELPSAIKRAEYGINHAPNVYPFKFQTSTKILEYLALGMGVVSSTSTWLDEFLKGHPGSVLDIGDISRLHGVPISEFEFTAPDMSAFSWERVWARSGINDVLLSLSEGR